MNKYLVSGDDGAMRIMLFIHFYNSDAAVTWQWVWSVRTVEADWMRGLKGNAGTGQRDMTGRPNSRCYNLYSLGSVWNLWTVYIWNFPISFRAAVNCRSMKSLLLKLQKQGTHYILLSFRQHLVIIVAVLLFLVLLFLLAGSGPDCGSGWQTSLSFFPTGYLIGGDVLRLLHGHMDECLTVPSGEHGEEQRRWAGNVVSHWLAALEFPPC